MKKKIIGITVVRHDLLHEEGSGCAMQVRKKIREWILEKGEK